MFVTLRSADGELLAGPRVVRRRDRAGRSDRRERAVGLGARARYEPEEVAGQNELLVGGRQTEQAHLRQLDSRMEPRSVRAEEELLRTGPLHGLDQQVEATHARRIGVDVRVALEMVDQ